MSDYRAGLYLIPQHMHGAVARYLEHGIQPGQFLTAMLSNNFMETMGRADDQNIEAIARWAQFIHCYVPSTCHGSLERVREWCGHRGFAGPEVQTEDAQ